MVHDMSLPPSDRNEQPDEEQQYRIPGLGTPTTQKSEHAETMPIISQKAVWQNAEDHGWHNPPADLTTDLLLIHSEISEACEGLRAGKMFFADGKGSVEEELADAVIRIFHVAQKNDINIGEAVRRKHMQNVERPYRHGNKAF